MASTLPPPSSSVAADTRPRSADQHESLAAQITAVAKTWARSQYRLVHLAARATVDDQWALDGAATPAAWLAALCDVESCTAREWIRIGHKLTDLPTIDTAFEDGEISYAKVRALTRVATPDNEHELLTIARTTPANHLARAIAAWLTTGDDPEALDRWHHQQRSLRWRCDPDGMTTFTLRLPPLRAAVLIAALTTLIMRTRPRQQQDRTWPTVAQQHTDELCNLLTQQVGTVDTEIVIHLHPDTTDPDSAGTTKPSATLDDGTPLTTSTVARALPEAFLRVMIHDAAGDPIAVSHRRRHPTTRQKRYVNARDQACVDCGRHQLLQYDHAPDHPAHTSRRAPTPLRPLPPTADRCYSFATISAMSSPASVGFSPTRAPASRRASIFASAVPFPPDTIAPAWPIFLPGGAVTPAT